MVSAPIPPLYKYLDVNGATLTLTNRNFRHARPSEFNDKEDMTVQRVFPEEHIESLTIHKNSFNDILLKNLNRTPTCYNPMMRMQVSLLQYVYRNNPDVAKLIRQTVQNDKVESIYDVEHMSRVNEDALRDVNAQLQGYRVLCLTKNRDSDLMWDRYADEHQGIVLRVIPNTERDSKLRLLKKVEYCEIRPPLFASTIEFIENSLFGNPEVNIQKYVDTIIYTKTKEWEYECEYRLAIPHFQHENWNTLPYHPEEIAEIYLGLHTTDENKEKFTTLAQGINPSIKIFQVTRNGTQELNFLAI